MRRREDGREPRRLTEEFPGGRGRYFPNEPALGAVANWNWCLWMARGRWVMVLHEDDALYPWYLDLVRPRLREGLAAVCTADGRDDVLTSARPRARGRRRCRISRAIS